MLATLEISVEWPHFLVLLGCAGASAWGARVTSQRRVLTSGMLAAAALVAVGGARGFVKLAPAGVADLATLLAYGAPLVGLALAAAGAARQRWPWRLAAGYLLGLPLAAVLAVVYAFL